VTDVEPHPLGSMGFVSVIVVSLCLRRDLPALTGRRLKDLNDPPSSAWVIEIPETVLKGQEGLRGVPRAYAVFATVQVTLAISGAVTCSRRFHSLYAILWPLITVAYLTLTTLSQIAD
jgi:hypothetical protein